MGTKKKQILIAIITLAVLFMLGGIIRLLATEDVEDLADEVIELTAEEKKEKVRDDNPESKKYLVTDDFVSRVLPKTKVEDFVKNFAKGEKITVYKDKTCQEEVASGEVCSGMYAKYEKNNRVFEISVLGDINEKSIENNLNNESEKVEEVKTLKGDGDLNEIECTRIIRGAIESEDWKIEEEKEKQSADITCDKNIEEADVNAAINYIVFGNIEAPKADKVESPSLSVVEGIKNEDGSFEGSAKVKLTQNDENGVRNTYRILRYQEEYAEVADEKIIELNETGVYTIIAYTYGELNNKSKGELKTVVVDNPSYNLTLVAGENIVSVKGEGRYKAGEKVEIDAVVKKDGSGYEYKWGIWTSENTDLVDNQASQKAEIIMPSENITLTASATRSLVNYSIEYNLNGGSLEEGVENPTEYTVETPTFTLNNPSRPGYIFDGWTTKEDEEPKKIVTIESGTIGDKVYTANWTEIGPISYQVKHYKENIEGSGYELAETENLSAKIGKEVSATVKEYKGFTYDKDNSLNKLTGTIKENEELVLEVYYKRNIYTLNLAKNENIESVEGSGEYKFEAPVTINATLKEEAGYRFEFEQWESSNEELVSNQKSANTEFTMPAGDLTLTANAIKYAREDTEYKVEYYYQENGTYPTTPNDFATRVGTTDVEVAVQDMDKQIAKVGYVFDELNEKNVLRGVVTAGENQLVLKVYFKQQLKVSYLPGEKGTFEEEVTKGLDYGTDTPAFVGELICTNGYAFAGWDKQVSETVTANVEYVAIWKPVVYQITYNLNNGSLEGTNPTTYTVESDDITLINPTRSGYIFKGWSGTDIDSTAEEVTIAKGSTGDRAYIANWEAEEYTIKYELNGGTLAKEAENPTKYTVETPTFTLYNPSKTGYEFLGWKGTDIQDVSKEVTVQTGSTGDREYTAIWSKNKDTAYKVKYYLEDLEGKSFDLVETLNLSGETEQFVEAEIKTFTGFTFDKDNTNNNLSGNIAADGSLVLKVYYTRNEYTLTLYTEKANHIIALIANGAEDSIGDRETLTITNNFKFGETIEIDATLAEKLGYTYTFTEWTTSDSNLLSNQTDKNVQFTMPAGNLTLTAKATETANISNYVVEYYYEDMEGNYPEKATSVSDKREALTGTTAVLEEADKVSNKVGYEYDTTAANVLTAEVKGDGTTKLKVYFRRMEYTLTVVAGENIEKVEFSDSTETTKTVKYGDKVTINAQAMQEAGYEITFDKWISSNSNLLDNQTDEEVTFAMPAGDLEITAVAERNLIDYSIEYNLNGGSLEEGVENPTKYTVETPTFTLNNPSKYGYIFDGWTTKEDEEPQKTVTIESGTIGNKVYTANWTEIGPISYQVKHYKENVEGSGYELAETENFAAKMDTEVSATVKEYKGFAYDSENVGNKLTGTIKLNEELVLEVYYKRNVYTLSLDKNENIDTVEGSGEYKFEAPVTINATLKEEAGYRFEFEQWESGNEELLSNQKSANTEFTMPAGDLTLTANASKYAKEDTKYTVEYYYQENGIYKEEATESTTRFGTTDTTISIKEEDKEPTKEGYIFDEKNTNNVIEGNIAGDGSLKLKLYFKQQLSVTYLSGDKGTFDKQETKGIDYGTVTPTFVGELTCEEGYTFAGWDKQVSQTVTENVEYVATWKPIVYQITYNLNNGSLEGTNPTTYTVEDEDITLINPTRSGYIFKGWSGTDIDSTAEDVTIAKGSTGDRAYIANWEAEEYTITYELNGGILSEEAENPTKYTIETPTFTLYNPSKTGYEFLGWKGTDIQDVSKEVTVQTGSTGDREYTATWSKNTDTPYIVEYYLENLEGESFDLVETSNLSGETEQFVEAEIKEFAGFTFDNDNENNKLSGNILGDGSLVLKVYYTRNEYTLTLYTEKANNIVAMSINGTEEKIGEENSLTVSKQFKFEEAVEIDATLAEKLGYTYTFTEWTTSDSNLLSNQTEKNVQFTMPAGDLTLTAKATEIANVSSYVVEYYYEDMEGNYPETATSVSDEREALTGTIAVLEEADKVSNKVGYEYDTTAANVLTAEVKGDGTTTLKVYFRRIEYTLTVVAGENIEKVEFSDSTETVKTVKYGDKVTINATLAEELGYAFEFNTWISSDEELLENQDEQNVTITMPAGDLTLTATATKTAVEVNYTVEYYYQVNGQYPETAESIITRKADTGTNVSITGADKVSIKEGYTYDGNATSKIEEDNVKADGTTVLKVYFKQQFKVTYKPGDKGLFEETTIENLDYGTATPDFSGDLLGEEGYTFIGWEPELEETVTKDAEYIALWSEITVPTITHTPTTWTNQDVTVTITAPEDMKALDIEYKIGEATEWTKYEDVFTVGENCTIYARLTAGTATGDEVSHDITNIDKVKPGIANLNIDTSNSDFAMISATLTDDLSGVVKYGISTSYELEPEYITCSNSLSIDVEFEEVYKNGTYYIWIKDAAGNETKQAIVISHIQPYMVAKIVEVPEGYEDLLGEYETLELALSTSDEAAQVGHVKIEIIHNIYDEDNTILNGRDYTIDLHDYTVKNQNESPALTVEGKLQIVDEGQEGKGKLVSLYDSGVYITLEGEFTLGTDDSSNPSTISPIIEGAEYGVEKEINYEGEKDEETETYPEGIFNFYDGKIIGQTAIKAQRVNDTPLLYDPTVITNSETEKQESTLAVVSGIEAVIGKKRYMLVEDAIYDANNNIGTQEDQIEITIVKDISKEQEVLVDSTKNIKLDLNGYVFTGTSSGYVLRNQGQLEIIDSSETVDEETGEKVQGTGIITGSAYNTIINEAANGIELEYENIDLSKAVSNGEYYFESRAEGLISNNTGVASTANSYIEIDLTDKVGIYEVVVNAEIGCWRANEMGYITVRNNTTAPGYGETLGRKVYIGGVVEATDYKFNLVGGEKYYIHLGYWKYYNGSNNGDYFAINSMKIGQVPSTTGVLTLTSGTIENTKVGTRSVYYSAIQNEGELYVNGGKISSTGNYSTLIDNAEETNSGFVQINGGELVGTYIGVRNFYGGVTDVYGGEVRTAYAGTMNYGVLDIYDVDMNASVSNAYNVENYEYGKTTIEGGIFTGSCGIYNNAPNYGYDAITIKGGTIDVNSSGIYNNNLGIIHVEDVIINRASTGVANNSTGEIIIDNIEMAAAYENGEPKVNTGIYNYNRGTITVNGGNIYSCNYGINIYYQGTVNINGGTIKSYYDYCAPVYSSADNAGSVINITDGYIEGKRTGIVHGTGDTINITGGHVVALNGTAIDNSYGNLIVGTKDGEVSNESPKIQGTEKAIANYDGKLYFYDGVLVGPENYVLGGIFNEIEENCEIVKEIKEDGLQYVTLGIPDYYVARISANDNPDVSKLDSKYYKLEDGYYYFVTLQSAVEACSINNQSIVEIIDDLWIYRTITTDKEQDIIIKFNDKTVRVYNEIAFDNFGKLQLLNETEGTYGNIFSNSDSIIENEENAEMQINNIQLDYREIGGSNSDYKKIISNNGDLEINNTYITSSEGTGYANYAYVIWNGENGTLATDNLTITGSIQSTVRIYNEGIDKEDEEGNTMPAVMIKNTTIGWCGRVQTGIKNNSSGSMYISDSNISERYAITNSSNGYIEIDNCIVSQDIRNESIGKILIKGEDTKGQAIYNDNIEGILEVQNGTFNYTSGSVVTNSGKLIITGGKFLSSTSGAYDYYRGISNLATGVATISGENTYIEGRRYGIHNQGTITINDARVVATYDTGIRNTSTGIVNFGTADGNVEFKPTVYGRLYGVYNEGTFNFYDGIIDGPTDASIGVKLDVTEEEYIRVVYSGEYNYDDGTESGYTVASGREISVLEQIEVAQLASTDKNYTSFKEALENAADTDTITVLTDATLISRDESLTIKDGQDITFDLAGFTISAGNSNTFINNGTLKITDSKVYEDEAGNKVVGSIINGADILVQNNGELTIEEVNLELTTGGSKDAYKTLIENNGTANINSATLTVKGIYSDAITATQGATTNIVESTLNGTTSYNTLLNLLEDTTTMIDSSKLDATSSYSYGIYNASNGNVTANNATTIIAETHNNAQGIITLENTTTTRRVTNNGEGIININGGTINYYDYDTIRNYSTGIINITGGSIKGDGRTIDNAKEGAINIDGTQTPVLIEVTTDTTTEAIVNDGTGNINIKGNVEIVTLGNTNYLEYGIYNRSTGTITLGDENDINNNVKINASDIGVYNLSGTFNYYGGTITAGSKAVQGRITDVPEEYQVLRSINEESKEVYEIDKTEAVAEANGTTYTTLKQAFNNTTTGTIKLLKNIVITEEDVITIGSNQDVILDLNSNLIKAHNHTETFINNGKFTITDNSENKEGTIEAENITIVKNIGEFTFAGGNINVYQHQTGKIIYNTVDAETNSNGTLNITGGTITRTGATINSYIIYSDSPNKISMSGGTININGSGSASYYTRGIQLEKENITVEMTGGTITGTSGSARGIYVGNNIPNATINISDNAEISSAIGIETNQNTIVNISGGNILNEAIRGRSKEAEVNITGGIVGKINGTGSSDKTTVNIYDGATLRYNGDAIAYTKNINIYGGEINGNISMGTGEGELNMTGGTINGIDYGIYFYNYITVTITGGTINASEGPGIKIASSYSTLILGEDTGGYPSKTVPEITGYTYGVENGGGTFNFYDGILRGSTYATSGTVTNTPELFTPEYSEDGTVATLGIIATFEQVALVNGIYYNTLESAITAAITTNAKIEICKDIVLQNSVEIPSGSAITIELNGNSIYGYTEDATIINNGTLTILDSSDDMTDTTIYSAIKNYSGTAIENNGVLTIGNSKDDVNTNSPRVIGTTIAIENNGTLNFYDGQIGCSDTANATEIVSGNANVTYPTDYAITVSGWNYILEKIETVIEEVTEEITEE